MGSDQPSDISGDFDPASAHNLIGDAGTSGGLADSVHDNLVGNSGVGTIDITTVIDTSLTDNGGPTRTHALIHGSAAVDAGDNALAIDQKGAAIQYDQRGMGFARINGGTVDIGAYEAPVLVEIDIKPGNDKPAANLASKGKIAVAILSTDSFDATLVDPSSVSFSGADSVHSALEDIDGDGDLDMVLHFNLADTNLEEIYAQLLLDDANDDGILDSTRQSASVSLSGETAGGEQIVGSDDVDLFFAGRALRDLLNELFAV